MLCVVLPVSSVGWRRAGNWLGQAGRWAVELSSIENQEGSPEWQNGRATAALPPYRPAALSNLEHPFASNGLHGSWQHALGRYPGTLGRPASWQRGWQGPATPCPLPPVSALERARGPALLYSLGGVWTNLAYGRSSDRKIAKTETWKEQHGGAATDTADSNLPIHQSSLQQYTHAPFGPSTAATITQQVWPGLACPAWSFLVFCPPLSTVFLPSHHITSHCASHLPSTLSASHLDPSAH